MATLRELFVKLGVNTDLAAVEAFDAGLQQVKASAQGLIKIMGGLAASLAGAGFAMWKMVRQTADAADAAATGAQRYGLTAETFQELEHAAQLSGTSIDTIGRGLRRVALKAHDAASGGEASAKAFRRLGISVRDSNGQIRASDELMMDVAERISKTTDSTEQLAIAIDVFGRAGEQLLPMLKEGRRGIENMRAEARDLGHVISAEAAAGFQELNNNLMRGRKLLEGWRNRLAVALLPKVNELVDRLLRWARANREVINSKIEDFAERVADFLDDTVELLEKVNDKVKEWGGWEVTLKRIGKAMAVLGILKAAGHFIMMGNGIHAAIMALKGFKIATITALAKPIAIGAAVVAVIAAIALAIEDVVVFMRGGDSLVGRFFEKFGAAENAREVIGKVGDAFKAFGKMVLAYGKILIKFWTTMFKVWWAVAGPFFKMLAGVLVWFWKTIAWPILGLLADAFVEVFGKITEALDWLNEHWDAVMGAFLLMAKDVGAWIQEYIISKVQVLITTLRTLMEALNKAKNLAGKIPGASGAKAAVMDLAGRARNAFAPSTVNNPRSPASNNMQMNGGTTNITVNAETNANPEQIASATASRVEDANNRQLRMAGAAFSGGEL